MRTKFSCLSVKELIAFIKIDYEGRKKISEAAGVEETVIDVKRDKYVAKEDRTLYIDHLIPDTSYIFNISAKFMDGWGAPYLLVVETSSEGKGLFSVVFEIVLCSLTK